MQKSFREILHSFKHHKLSGMALIHGHDYQKTSHTIVSGGGVVINGIGGSSISSTIKIDETTIFWLKFQNGPDLKFIVYTSVPVSENQLYEVDFIKATPEGYSSDSQVFVILRDKPSNRTIVLQGEGNESLGYTCVIKTEKNQAAIDFIDSAVGRKCLGLLKDESQKNLRSSAPLKDKIVGYTTVATFILGIFYNHYILIPSAILLAYAIKTSLSRDEVKESSEITEEIQQKLVDEVITIVGPDFLQESFSLNASYGTKYRAQK